MEIVLLLNGLNNEFEREIFTVEKRPPFGSDCIPPVNICNGIDSIYFYDILDTHFYEWQLEE